MKTLLVKLLRSERGATAIEYALIASFIAVVCVTAMGLVGTNLNTKFDTVQSALT